MKISFLLILSSVFLFGCYNFLLPFPIPTRSPKIPKNDIQKEIPIFNKNKISKFYKFCKQKQNQLALSIPENGFDSLQLRFWFTYPEGFYQFGELLEINFSPGEIPVAKYYRLNLFFNPTREYEVINNYKDSVLFQPKSGWFILTKMLSDLKITQLPTISDLAEFQDSTNRMDLFNNTSLTVVTEVSTKTFYRFFEYNNFEKYSSIDEVNRLYTFIKFVREEFSMFPIDKNWYYE